MDLNRDLLPRQLRPFVRDGRISAIPAKCRGMIEMIFHDHVNSAAY